MEERMILLHGFGRDEVMKILKAVKSVASDPSEIAFSVTTENNLTWTVQDLVKEVREEHEYMKANPPGRSG
jgi:hypothetical protein